MEIVLGATVTIPARKVINPETDEEYVAKIRRVYDRTDGAVEIVSSPEAVQLKAVRRGSGAVDIIDDETDPAATVYDIIVLPRARAAPVPEVVSVGEMPKEIIG